MPQDANPGIGPADSSVVSCAGLRRLAALGECAPGRKAVEANTNSLYGDNPALTSQPIVNLGSPAASRQRSAAIRPRRQADPHHGT